jgi:hypothetical protein
MKSESFLESYWFMNTMEFVKDCWPDKIWLTTHCVAELMIVGTKPNCRLVQRNGGGT